MQNLADLGAIQRDFDRKLPDDYNEDSDGNEYNNRFRFDNYIEGLDEICESI